MSPIGLPHSKLGTDATATRGGLVGNHGHVGETQAGKIGGKRHTGERGWKKSKRGYDNIHIEILGGEGLFRFVLDRLQPLTVQRVRSAGKESNPTRLSNSRPPIGHCWRGIPPTLPEIRVCHSCSGLTYTACIGIRAGVIPSRCTVRRLGGGSRCYASYSPASPKSCHRGSQPSCRWAVRPRHSLPAVQSVGGGPLPV